jgi:hypothetical protein
MAYEHNSLPINDVSDGTGNLVISLPGTAVNDFVILVITGATGTATHSMPAGWNLATGSQAVANGQRLTVWTKLITSAPEPDPTLTLGLNEPVTGEIIIVRGVNTANPINAAAKSDWNALITVPSTALTTTVNNCLIFYIYSSDNASTNNPRLYLNHNQLHPIGLVASNNSCTVVGSRYQRTAGAIPTINATMDNNTEGGTTLSIAIEDSGLGEFGPDASTTSEIIERHTFSNGTLTWAAPNSEPSSTSILGVGLSAIAPTVGYAASSIKYPSTCEFTSAQSTASLWVGGIRPFTAGTVNLLGKVCGIFKTSGQTTLRIGAQGHAMQVFDATGKWAVFQINRRRDMAASGATRGFFFVPGFTTPTEVGPGGAPNYAALTKEGYFEHRAGSSTTSNTFGIGALITYSQVLVGGSVYRPLNLQQDYLRKHDAFGYLVATSQGERQVLYKSPIQIGDGATPTYFSFEKCGLEVPLAYNLTAGRVDWNVPELFCDIDILGAAGDTFIFRNCLLNASVRQTVSIHPSCSTSITIPTTGMSASGFEFIWKTGIPFSGANLSGCYTMDGKGAAISNCAFSQCLSTGAASLIIRSGASLSNNTFTKGSENNAVEIADAGTYSSSNVIYNNYGANGSTTAAIFNNSGGLVTINLQNYTDQIPTVRNSPGSTTIINALPKNISVTGAVSGSRILVRNETTDTEISNALGTSYIGTYTEGTGFTTGDTYSVTVTNVNKLEKVYTGVVSSIGFSVSITQDDDTVYIGKGFDGSTFTGITFNTSTIDLDLDGSADPLVLWGEAYARYKYQTTLTAGIRELIGAMFAKDSANYLFANTLILNNLSATPVKIGGDGFAARRDGATMFGTGNIQIDNSVGVVIAEGSGGGSAPTAAQIRMEIDANSTQLAAIKSKTDNLPSDPADQSLLIIEHDATQAAIAELTIPSTSAIAAAVRAEMDANSTKLDVATSTRLAGAGYTAPNNADIAAIKAKTDQLTINSGLLDVNVESSNNHEVIGTGTEGDPWRGVGVSP